LLTRAVIGQSAWLRTGQVPQVIGLYSQFSWWQSMAFRIGVPLVQPQGDGDSAVIGV